MPAPNITAPQLAVAVGIIGSSGAPLTADQTAQLTRLIAAAKAHIAQVAPDAPVEIANEAVVRYCGYLLDSDPSQVRSSTNPFVSSGAGPLLAPFRKLTLGLPTGTPPPSPGPSPAPAPAPTGNVSAFFFHDTRALSPDPVAGPVAVPDSGDGYMFPLLPVVAVPGAVAPDSDFVAEFEGVIYFTPSVAGVCEIRLHTSHSLRSGEVTFTSTRVVEQRQISSGIENLFRLSNLNTRSVVRRGEYTIGGKTFTLTDSDFQGPTEIGYTLEFRFEDRRDGTRKAGQLSGLAVAQGETTAYQLRQAVVQGGGVTPAPSGDVPTPPPKGRAVLESLEGVPFWGGLALLLERQLSSALPGVAAGALLAVKAVNALTGRVTLGAADGQLVPATKATQQGQIFQVSSAGAPVVTPAEWGLDALTPEVKARFAPSLTGEGGKFLRVNSDGTAVELAAGGSADAEAREGVAQNLASIGKLQAATSDLRAGSPATGWSDLTDAAQGGLVTVSDATEAQARAASGWAAKLSSFLNSRITMARIPATADPRQYRVLITGKQGQVATDLLSHDPRRGANAGGQWHYYYTGHLGDNVASIQLQATGSAAHVGTSQFGGVLTGSVKAGLIDLDALAASVLARIAPAFAGEGGKFLAVKSDASALAYVDKPSAALPAWSSAHVIPRLVIGGSPVGWRITKAQDAAKWEAFQTAWLAARLFEARHVSSGYVLTGVPHAAGFRRSGAYWTVGRTSRPFTQYTPSAEEWEIRATDGDFQPAEGDTVEVRFL
ncbi:MAG: hypothetical protein OXI45_13655 [Acidobacteriota bacterium]|nr:hypothetical protein [Acidobacteriota bacterium]